MKCFLTYAVMQFTNFGVVDAMLPIMPNLRVRVGDHSGFSTLTRKMLKSKTTTAVKDHMFFCDHMFSLEDFKIWQIIQNFFLRSKKVLKSHDKPELNRNEKSLPLYIFD